MQFYNFLNRKTVSASLFLVVFGLWLGSPLMSPVTLAVSRSAGAPGTVFGWGDNSVGQMGNGTNSYNTTPGAVSLPNGLTATALASGSAHAMVIGSDNTLYTWGLNSFGQLGNGSTVNSNLPTAITLAASVAPATIAAGYYHSLAIGSDSKLYAWGLNNDGQLGNGTTSNSSTPIAITLANGVVPTAIAGGMSHSLAIGNDGKLYAWGDNTTGQLGNGNNNPSTTPILVSFPAGVTPTAIASYNSHSLAIGSDNKLYAWGLNSFGQLGIGNTTDSNVPVVVALPAGVAPTAIATGYYYSLAIGSDNKLYAWGDNGAGELGNGTTNQSNTPIPITLASGVAPSAIAAGTAHSLAIGNDGNLYAWGSNDFYQLGDGSTARKTAPERINLSVGKPVRAVAAGKSHSLGLLTPGPSFSINNVSKVEGNNGPANLVFTVTLSKAASQSVTVDYATSDGTATAPTDYTATSGTLTFPPGTLSQSITVQVNGDTLYEADETFKVVLSNANGALLGLSTGTGTILNDDSSLSLTANPNPSLAGQNVAFTATISPGTATGSVTFSEGANVLQTVTLANGSAVFNTAALSVGSHTITASYSGDANYGASSNQVVQIVNLNPTSLSLTSDPNPSVIGQNVTFTANLSPAAATGTVNFTIDGGAAIPVALTNGQATYTTNTLTAGTHSVGASYGGNASYAPATAQTLTQVVNLNTTSLSLTSTPNPALVYQNVTFRATISPVSATGTITFTDGATVLGTAPLTNGIAEVSTSNLGAGSHTVTATYGSDGTYASSSANTTQTVNLNSTSLSLTTNPNPASVGQSVTFTATVSPDTAQGVVYFMVDNNGAIQITLVNGVATYTTNSIRVGSHTIKATFSGNSLYDTSTASLTQLVNLNSTTVDLTSDPTPPVIGQNITFIANVSPSTATGTVRFADGATALGTAPVSNGKAVFTTNGLSAGNHVILATYSGDATYSGSTGQLFIAGCAPFVVTSKTDDGTGTQCGTLSYALVHSANSPSPITISFALTQGNTVTFTGNLTAAAKVQAKVTLAGGTLGSANRIILDGQGVNSDGLHVAGSAALVNLTLKRFGGRGLVIESPGNRLQGVIVDCRL